jgi:hypothetical protein
MASVVTQASVPVDNIHSDGDYPYQPYLFIILTNDV